jgi:hypothetical protein
MQSDFPTIQCTDWRLITKAWKEGKRREDGGEGKEGKNATTIAQSWGKNATTVAQYQL